MHRVLLISFHRFRSQGFIRFVRLLCVPNDRLLRDRTNDQVYDHVSIVKFQEKNKIERHKNWRKTVDICLCVSYFQRSFSKRSLNMCYVVITCRSLAWFLLTLVCDLFILTAMVTPKWLIGPQQVQFQTSENTTMQRSPSVGINTRYN